MDIIRAWKDADYRNSLSEAERAALPENPAGSIPLTEEDLGAIAGGRINLSRVTQCSEDGCGLTVNCPTTNTIACAGL